MTDIDLAAIRERYDAWKRISDAGNDDLGEGTVAMVLAGNDVPALLAAVERLTAERDQVACERDGVREELARMAGDLDDARSERDRLRGDWEVARTAHSRKDAMYESACRDMGAIAAERDAMRPVVEAAVAWRREALFSARASSQPLIAAVDAYTAAQTPGVDTGTSEARTAGSGETAAESEPIPAELSTHYGPTATDPEPGKEWHDDCGGEVYSFKEGRICSKCEMAEDAPAAHGGAGPADGAVAAEPGTSAPRFLIDSGGVTPIRVEVDPDRRVWITGSDPDGGQWGWRLKPDESLEIAMAILAEERPGPAGHRVDLSFASLSQTNRQRCQRWHPGFPEDSWTGADWSNAMQGEAGEAGNVVKKLRRAILGTREET